MSGDGGVDLCEGGRDIGHGFVKGGAGVNDVDVNELGLCQSVW